MLLNVGDLSAEDLFDYCIIGTGPAGITCALSLAKNGTRVVLLEGGEREYTERSQNLYRGQIVGDPYFPLDELRLRYFGGTSNHWGGLCRTLDAFDFEAKGAFQDTKWPIAKDDLDPYFQPAADILEIPDLPGDQPIVGSGFNHIHFLQSPPVLFAEKFGERLEADAGIFLLFDANVTSLETNGESITGAQIVDSDGNRRRVQAGRYILATGGIENNRLLLWSNIQTNGQVVKAGNTLGKYWTEHPTFTLGEAILNGDFPSVSRELSTAFFAPTPDTIIKEGILNCGLFVNLVPHEGAKKIIADVACVAPDLGKWALNQLGKRLICVVQIRAAWEQEPRAVNRIELSDERDALGIPRPRLHWQKGETDLRTPQITARRFGEYMARSKIGRLRLNPWVLGEGDMPGDDNYGGFPYFGHHIGGTRMAASAEHGVVDSNCKVFGQTNLYIAGSSVFASGGHANPTLTIVQLALRLVDHLRATN
jgi:choline dehydrogenase-like flavoprotein